MANCPHEHKAMSSRTVKNEWGDIRPWICRDCGQTGSHFTPVVDEYTHEMVKRHMAGAAFLIPDFVKTICEAHEP